MDVNPISVYNNLNKKIQKDSVIDLAEPDVNSSVLDLLNECQRIRQKRFLYLQRNFFEHRQELNRLLDPNTGRIQAQLEWQRKDLLIDMKPTSVRDKLDERLQKERFHSSENRIYAYQESSQRKNHNGMEKNFFKTARYLFRVCCT